MTNNPLTHGEIINRLVKDTNASITDMSRETGIKRTTIYSIINQNQKQIKPNMYNKIAAYFNIPADVFFKQPMTEVTYNVYAPTNKNYASIELKKLLDEYNRTYEFVYNALRLADIKSYSLDDIKQIIDGNKIPSKGYSTLKLEQLITEIIIKGTLISNQELSLVLNYRHMDNEDQLLLIDIMNRLKK